jgi:hypothetical protein
VKANGLDRNDKGIYSQAICAAMEKAVAMNKNLIFLGAEANSISMTVFLL